MINVTLTNTMLKLISAIDQNRFSLSNVQIPALTANKLRKNSKKKSSYASTKIEGNPLTEKQVDEVIDSDPHRHFLKPEQEVRNYFLAVTCSRHLTKNHPPDNFLLEVGASCSSQTTLTVSTGYPREPHG